MKIQTGVNILRAKDIEKSISKKIILANTSSKKIDKKVLKKAVAASSDPEYNNDNNFFNYNTDIRYRNYLDFSPLHNIEYRNVLFMFSENKEIKKAVRILANELVATESDEHKYPVYPELNLTEIDDDKQNVGKAIVDYLSDVFYPKLWQYYNFKKEGLLNTIKDFLITGKLAYEIVYDSLKNPKEIVGIIPIDPGSLQKISQDGCIYYVQRSNYDNKERVLSENQVILCEWNKYDYGYVSYVDGLRMSFNIMRSMQTSKILWFATKSQVRMHIKMAYGDVSREEAKQKLSEARNNYTNKFQFSDDGQVLFNNLPNNSGYREFYTAETAASGHPEIEEITGNGPDLTETESLQYWERLFWNDTEIPYDRIDPNSSDSWGFLDVEALKKTEIIFSKFVESIRMMLEDIFLKPIIIQLTLKQVDIGIDLELLDSIKICWQSYNQYEKMADLAVLQKKVEVANNIKDFGIVTNAADKEIPMFSVSWLARNILDFDEDKMSLIEQERIREYDRLGYNSDGTPKEEMVEASMGITPSMMNREDTEDEEYNEPIEDMYSDLDTDVNEEQNPNEIENPDELESPKQIRDKENDSY